MNFPDRRPCRGGQPKDSRREGDAPHICSITASETMASASVRVNRNALFSFRNPWSEPRWSTPELRCCALNAQSLPSIAQKKLRYGTVDEFVAARAAHFHTFQQLSISRNFRSAES